MAIIRAADAEDVSSFTFGDDVGAAADTRTWRVADEPAGSLPAPHESQEPQRVAEPSLPPGPGELLSQEQPVQQPAPQPIFEVPEEILAGFYEQAVAAGLEDGKNQVFAELTVLQERFASALSNLAAVGQELASRNQVQLMSLACIVAEKLIRHEVSVRPQLLLELIGSVLSEHAVRDDVVVQCSPGDYEFIAENKAFLLEGTEGAFSLRVEQNPEFEYGDFNIETQTGSIDGSVASRMKDVQSSLGGGTDV